MRRSRAFTLVELLVVIGIIALLMSILLPSLNKARMQAYRVQCANNERQMLLAEKMYESEWKGKIMWANWGSIRPGGVPNLGVPGWLYRDPLPTVQPFPQDAVREGLVFTYLNKSEGNDAIFHCPLDQPPYVFGGTSALTSYLMNGSMLDFGNASANPTGRCLDISRFRPWAVIWFEADETNQSTGAVWNDGSSFPDEELLSTRHQKGANVAYVDGHVEWWSPEDYNKFAYANFPGHFSPNPLWCAPDLRYGGDRGAYNGNPPSPFQ